MYTKKVVAVLMLGLLVPACIQAHSQNEGDKSTGPMTSQDQAMKQRNTRARDVSTTIVAVDDQGRARAQRLIKVYALLSDNPTLDAIRPYVADDYVQHSPMLPDGPEGLVSFFASAVTQFPLEIDVHRVLVMGDWAMAHVNFRNLTTDDPEDLGMSAVDIYTFGPDGKLTEHWDAVQSVPFYSVNPHGMFLRVRGEKLASMARVTSTSSDPASTSSKPSSHRDPTPGREKPSKSSDQQMNQRNSIPEGVKPEIIAGDAEGRARARRLVEVYELLASRPTIEGLRNYAVEDYVQHSTMLPDGPEGVAMFFASSVAQYPVRIDVHRVMVIGDWAMAHVNFRNLNTDEPGDLGMSAVDIYTFGPDGRVTEHWDAVQSVPAYSVNPHGMFVRVREDH